MPIPWIPRNGAAGGTDLPGFSSAWDRALPPPDFGSLQQDKARLDRDSPAVSRSPARALSHARRSTNTAQRAPPPFPPLISEHRHQLYFPNTTDMHRGHLRARRFLHLLRELGFSSTPHPGGLPARGSRSPCCGIAGFPASSENGALLRRDVPLPPGRWWRRCQVRSVVRMRRAMAAAPGLC